MALTEYKFGDLLELTNQKNSDGKYGEDDAIGVNIDKVIQPMKGHLTEKDFTKFHLVPPQHFAYNPRGSRKLGIGFNNTQNTYIITFNDNVFKLRDSAKCIILATYLFMYLCRKEWDRYAEFISWGSSTEVFDWKYFCDEKILLPPISVQQKYVDIYNAMLANQQSYEHGLDDLKLTCDAYIEKCKTSSDYFSLSELIEEFDERNTNLICNAAFGVNKEKQFMPTVASGDDLSKYKVVRKGQFACNLMHVGRDITIPVAFNNSTDFLVVSPAYLTFQTKSNLILPEYLLMWLSRGEIGRYAWYLCDASIRGSMEKKRFFEIAIPVPPIKEQQALVELFSALSIRKELLNKLRMQVKSLCPILIKGSIEEGMRTNEA